MNDQITPMTVEQDREGKAWGLRAPTVPGTPEHDEQFQDALLLCQGAKSGVAWPQEVLDILNKYKSGIDFDMNKVPELMLEFKDYRGPNFTSWRQVVDFVEQDECPEIGMILHRYIKQQKMPVKKNRDFIDGGGVGFYQRLCNRLGRKGDSPGSLEKTFDQKKHFDQIRPIAHLAKRIGSVAAAIRTACYNNPGHQSYPAGHGTKADEPVDQSRDEYELTPDVDMTILVGAYVIKMGRSGALMHYPEDNCASGFTAGLPEFAEYGA